ncbi:MAG: TetR/AcrR family transcriptional regulator [Acetobacteraceae bacterium]|nr:TetR/AcrR family transcriptional regulator [Acetobacteraceae bacterium]
MIEQAESVPRPRLEARRRAFLDAATTAFLEKGYANTTLDDVIARSGGSRQTLYALFGGKQGLFEALVSDRCSKIFEPLALEGLPERAPDEVLLDLGVRYLDTVLEPDTLGVYRVVVAEAGSMKELGERFWEMGPGRTRALLARYFARQARLGGLRLEDPEQAANEFLGMLLGPYQMQCLLGLRDRPSRDELTRFVSTAVARFLDGCRAQTGADAGRLGLLPNR